MEFELGGERGGELPAMKGPMKPRVRSSLRQRYEAEAKVIERRLGGLEAVRISLGLSQRKMAQLLLVDPSAWTRWTQEQNVPPHIWRALAWYLALQDKYPALDAAFWLQGVARSADSDRISQNADEIRAQKLHTRSLEIKIQALTGELNYLKDRTESADSNGITRLSEIAESRDNPYSNMAPNLDSSSEGSVDPAKNQADTRALANLFLALTFTALGYAIAAVFAK